MKQQLKYLLILFFLIGAFAGTNARIQNEKQILEFTRITRREFKGKSMAGQKNTTKETKAISERYEISGMGRKMGDQKISGESIVIATIQKYFGNEWQTAVAICNCESKFNHLAVGDTNLNPPSYGLFQIRAFANRAPVEELLTVEGNIREAKRIYDTSGWSAWSCFYKI